MAFGSNGFTVLAWVNPDSPMIDGLGRDACLEMKKALLEDFKVLIGTRWTMDVVLIHKDYEVFAFGHNPRITVGEGTIRNALGELQEHVHFSKGTASNSADDLIAFKQCKDKWKVPEVVTTSTTGWPESQQASTSFSLKRKRT